MIVGIILSFIIFLIIIFTIVIKLKFRFWSEQPVFHVYDISYYLFYSGIIHDFVPKKTRYTNFKNIETLIFGKNMKQMDPTRFVQLLNRII